MDTRLENGSAGTKEWLEATQGWTIYAYAESGIHVAPIGISKDGASPTRQPLPVPRQRRREWPFGENIRDAIRAFKGK